MNLTVSFETIYEGDPKPLLETVDLSNEKILFGIFVGLGNGIYDELRVTGHSKEAAYAFIRLIQAGGYPQGIEANVRNKTLYRSGDGCFPEDGPFIFVSPSTVSGEHIDFGRLEAEMQEYDEDKPDSISRHDSLRE